MYEIVVVKISSTNRDNPIAPTSQFPLRENIKLINPEWISSYKISRAHSHSVRIKKKQNACYYRHSHLKTTSAKESYKTTIRKHLPTYFSI